MTVQLKFPVADRQIRPGMRVLVVEDSFMAASAMVEALVDLGMEVVGPAPTVQAAMRHLDQSRCDGALLDINLGGETSEGVAWRLDRQGIPFIFVSGYESPLQLLKNENFRGRRLLSKPLEADALRKAVEEEFGAGPNDEAGA